VTDFSLYLTRFLLFLN